MLVMLVLIILITFILPLIYFISVNPKIKYIFWIFGILYWNNPYFFSIVTSHFKSSMDNFFLVIGISVFFIPTVFIFSSIQTLIKGFLQRNYVKILISMGLLVFTFLYYKDATAVRVVTFDWLKFILRLSIILGTLWFFFQNEDRISSIKRSR